MIDRNRHVPPNWIAVRINETSYFDERFVERCGGAVYGIYLVDTNSVTYCCSAEKTYCLHLMDTVSERILHDDEASEQLHEELMEISQDSPKIVYVQCHAIDEMPEEHRAAQPTPDDWSAMDDRGYAEVREGYCGNPDF